MLRGKMAWMSIVAGALVAAQAAPAQVNDHCANATPVAAPSTTFGDTLFATNDGTGFCGASATSPDVWFTLTNAQALSAEFTIDTVGSDYDTVLSAFSACGGSELACNDDFVGLQSSIDVVVGPNTTVTIRVSGFAGDVGSFTLNISAPGIAQPPPSNDDCPNATPILALPFISGPVSAGSATPDTDVSCNDEDAIATHNGVWFRYTATSNQSIRIRETTPSTFALIAVFTGGCGGAETACSFSESVVVQATTGTQLLILVGAPFEPFRVSAVINLSVTGVIAPTNDTCATARFIQSFPFTEDVEGSAAGPDQDVSCNDDDNTVSPFGVWYTLTPNEGGTVNLTENSINGAAITLFEGPCAALTEVACSDFGFTGPVAVTAGRTYHILVSTWFADESPTEPYELNFTFTPSPGACCVGPSCTIVRDRAACTLLGGEWRGVGVTCGGPTNYTITTTTAPFQDISATGTLLTTISDCDDCGERVQIGFPFNFLGAAQTDVWVCSNGFLQFGEDESGSFVNQPIPNPNDPNNMLCPLWDDLFPGDQGEVFALTEGVAPSRRFIVSWVNVTQFAVEPNDSQNFQIVLFEGSNNVEFRYGAIVPDAGDFGGGADYTIGFENVDGTAGGSFNSTLLGAGNTALLLTAGGVQPGPCGTPTSGACCNRTQCSVLAQGACTGAGTRFAGTGTSCNAPGNFTTPCCRADVGQSGSISLQDLFDYLDLWFAAAPAADFDQFPGVTVGDVFAYLGAWFGGGC